MFLFRKGVYSYEYIDNKEKFNEKSLPEKEDLYRHLSMEDVIDAHAKRVCKELKKKKNSREYYDLYFQSDTCLLADVFEFFRNMCFKICDLDPVRFFTAPGLA